MSSRAVTYRVDDRRSADRATDAVMNSLGLRPGGFREALRAAILETAHNVADWAGSGGDRPWAIPWPCCHDFLSVVTNRRIWGDRASSPQEAWRQMAAWAAL